MRFNSIITLVFFFLFISSKNFAQDKPQTPKPPYSYINDSVEYDNADKTVHLGATFSYPEKGGQFTTIVMITGSGQQDRDETIFNHKPFAVIADYLTKRGFAVLRVDDRGMGKSKGTLKNVTSEDFADDVITSVNYLLTRKEVNKNKIGLMGHSEGGFIAPIVYSKTPNIAFIVSLAGPGVSGADILLRQQTDPVKGKVSNDAFDAFYDLTKRTLNIIKDNHTKPDSIVMLLVRDLYKEWKKDKPDSLLASINADKVTPEIYAMSIKPELIPWLRYFIATDPFIFWSKVKCPVLAFNGAKDIQVYPDENLNAIKKALIVAGNKNFKIKKFKGLNHLFQHCKECTVQEYAKLDETFSPKVLKVIYKWLKKEIK
ncbi:MAG: alpha/beta fold hydrolase [Bacteroidetes bacterium]|nr:alpha/beta fold hydrolase [Bacteroidota bacterium]